MRTLRDFPVEVSPGRSAIAPVRIDGLPAEIQALGRTWQRKTEFHLTVIGETVIQGIGQDDPSVWDRVAQVVAGRSVEPVYATRELRRVSGHPDKPGLETIVVMVECPKLVDAYGALSAELGAPLGPPPAHVTLYSTDPQQGIGLNNEAQLRERAPALSAELQEEVRRTMRFDEVF